jgi:hypothetical protein
MRLGQSNIAVALFTQGGTGKAGLTDVVMTVRSTPMSGTSTTTLYTGASAFEIGGGAYGLMLAASNFASATVVNYAATTTNTANVDAGACFGTCWAIAAAADDGVVASNLFEIDSQSVVSGYNATLKLKSLEVVNATGTAIKVETQQTGAYGLWIQTTAGEGQYAVNVVGDAAMGATVTANQFVGTITGNLAGNVTGGIGGTVNVSVDPATIADAVWDESAAGHTGTLTNVTRIDVATSTRATPADVTSAIASAGISVTAISPVDAEGETTIVQGDTYQTGTGNDALIYTVTGFDTSIPTNGATVTLKLCPASLYRRQGASAAELSATGTASLSGTTLTLSIPLTGTATAALSSTVPPAASPNYKAIVTLTATNGAVITQVIADASVLKRLT